MPLYGVSIFLRMALNLFHKKLVTGMTSDVSAGHETEKGQPEVKVREIKDGGPAHQAETFKRWQTAYRLAETYALLNQSKPSFEARFKLDQAGELFLSLSEDYVALGVTKDRFPGTPIVPRSVQDRLDQFGRNLDAQIKTRTDPRDLPKQRREVLDTLLDPSQTDPILGIKTPEDLDEKCKNLDLSTRGALGVIEQFRSFRKEVAAQLSPDRNHLKGLVSQLWDQLAEGASAETRHAQERADKRARLLHLDEDLFDHGEAVEISSRASSRELVVHEQGDGSGWHTVTSSSGNSEPYYKKSPPRSLPRLGSPRSDLNNPGSAEHEAPKRMPGEDRELRSRWHAELNHLEEDFNRHEENLLTERIEAWRNAPVDAESEPRPVRAEPPHLKRAASEISDSQSKSGDDKPSTKRPKLDERDDRSSGSSTNSL